MVFEWSYDPQWLTEVDPLDFLIFAYGPLMNSVVISFLKGVGPVWSSTGDDMGLNEQYVLIAASVDGQQIITAIQPTILGQR